jgi:HlyD family secretion protein
MKKILRILLILLVLGAIVWTFYFLYDKSKEKPVFYTTEKAERTTIIKKSVATGSIIPRKEIAIKPQVSGIVEKLYFEPGDKVKAGDLIAKVKIIPDMAALNSAENRLNRAKISLDGAKRDYDRFKALFEKGIISSTDWQQYEIAYKNALEELDAAENNLEIIREGASKKTGSAANTLIKSTSTGMILEIPVEEGNSVIETNNFNEGTTIALIADLAEMIFVGKVDESEVGKLTTGMELIISIGAIQDETFAATLEYIAPKGKEENGAVQFEIKAQVSLNDNFFIRAGYSANADIVLARAEDVLAIKESLLQFDGDKPYVEVAVGEGKYERRDVVLGLSDGIMVEVKSGITETDEIKAWNKPITDKPEKH